MSQPDEFVTPPPPGGNAIDLNPLQGSLLVIEVTGIEEDVQTAFSEAGKPSPAVRANVAVVDGNGAGESYDDVLIWPRYLQGQLRRNVGKKVLGRLTRGVPKQAGQSPPWELSPASNDDLTRATEWANRRRFAQPSQPAQPTGNATSQAPF